MPQNQTHEIVVLKPKPEAQDVALMVTRFFDAEAARYDTYNDSVPARRLYIAKVNELIASKLKQSSTLRNLLSIAAGTGKREVDIKNETNKEFEITCVDISSAMCDAARERGLNAVQGSWETGSVELEAEFDAVLYLLAFGLLSTIEQRKAALNLANKALNKGGHLFIDVLNLDDLDEWGPRIKELFSQEALSTQGYDIGDVFYRRVGEHEVSFTHYFTKSEMSDLLQQAGFDVCSISNIGYGSYPGELLDRSNSGNMLFIARKR